MLGKGNASRLEGMGLADWAFCGAAAVFYAWYAWPALSLGADDLRLISYFRADDANCLAHWARIYREWVVPTRLDVGYPTLYYYLAGIFLIPYTKLAEPDLKVYVAAFRFMQYLCLVGIASLGYFLGAKTLKSRLAGLLTGAALMASPVLNLWFTSNRPQLLALLLLFAALYFLARSLEQRRSNLLYGAVICAALSFSAQYMGLFLLPAIFMAYLLHLALRREGEDAPLSLPRRWHRLAALAWLAAGVLAIICSAALGWYLARRQMDDWSILVYAGAAAGLLMALMGVLYWAAAARAGASQNSPGERRRQGILGAFWLATVCSASFFFIYLASNPQWLAFPANSLNTLITVFNLIFMGKGAGAWMNYGAAGLGLSKVAVSVYGLGPAGLVLAAVYVVWEASGFRRNWRAQPRLTAARLGLAGFSLSYLVFPVAMLHSVKHHYLAPLLLPAFALGSYASLDIIKRSAPAIKPLAGLGLAALMLWALWLGGGQSIEDRQRAITTRQINAAYELANWMRSHVPAEARICSDHYMVYIPPRYKNPRVLSEKPAENSACQVVLDAMRARPDLGRVVKGFHERFRLATAIKYKGTEWFESESEPWPFLAKDPYIRVYVRDDLALLGETAQGREKE